MGVMCAERNTERKVLSGRLCSERSQGCCREVVVVPEFPVVLPEINDMLVFGDKSTDREREARTVTDPYDKQGKPACKTS